MATVKDMAEEYIREMYELCVFLRLHGHSSLGERIMSAAIEVSSLSRTTWARHGNESFFDNLVKTHEMADKLTLLIGLVEYLDLGYSGLEKAKLDTEAIYKMSRSSINTVLAKLNGNKKVEKKVVKDDSRPTEQLKTLCEQNEQEQKTETPVAAPAAEDPEEKAESCSNGLPFELGENSENNGGEVEEEMKESA